MKFLDWLFPTRKIFEKDLARTTVNICLPPKPPEFEIEHYPITGRFYPKYRGDYIQRNSDTGIYGLLGEHLFAFADYGTTEQNAQEIIRMFKEQRLKDGVIKIKV